MQKDVMIYKQAAIDAIHDLYAIHGSEGSWIDQRDAFKAINTLPSAQPEQTRIFVELVVEYPDPELCTYKEYKGKPYYSIKYIEDGERYVGYGTYKPEVLSQYLREYFMSSAQSEQRWIPVRERLPEENSDILVTYVEKDEKRIVPVNYGCGIWFDCIFDRALNPVSVLAWTLFPEPYREDGKSDG